MHLKIFKFPIGLQVIRDFKINYPKSLIMPSTSTTMFTHQSGRYYDKQVAKIISLFFSLSVCLSDGLLVFHHVCCSTFPGKIICDDISAVRQKAN